MKQIVVVFRAALLIAALASLAACSGVFVDPGHLDAGVIGGSGGSGGGDGGSGGGSGGGGSGGSGGKPDPLSNNATYNQAVDKLDEIIAYCNAHPGTINDGVKNNVESLKNALTGANSSTIQNSWGSGALTMIININQYIDLLE
jgi:hypothetical protein